MEKVFIKPTAEEIIVKGTSPDGHADIYSYDYESDDNKRRLGNLFIIGNVTQSDGKTDPTEVAYITNLVASLAKREYYSKPDQTPREAFSGTLKKINDVVEEFFKNQNLKINIGVFAIADDSVLISRLGKFRILLARDKKNIDILNNVDLFSKEHAIEKKFSNIVSGKLHPGDKILAFYPNRSITAREKTIKDLFLKSEAEQFSEKLNAIKGSGKSAFACAALFINIDQLKETAIAPNIQPHELLNEDDEVITPVVPNSGTQDLEPRLAKNSVPVYKESYKPKQSTSVKTEDLPVKPAQVVNIPEEMPKIIASEFSLGKKKNSLASIFGKVKMPKLDNRNKKFASLAVVAVAVIIVVGASFTVKSVISRLNNNQVDSKIVAEAQSKIDLAKTKISSDNFQEARALLIDSLNIINPVTASDAKKSENISSQVAQLLDSIDKAVDASPVLSGEIPQELGNGLLISAIKDSIYVFSTTQDGKNYLSIIEDKSIKDRFEISGIKPTSAFADETSKYIGLVDSVGGQVVTFNTVDNKTKNSSFAVSSPSISLNLYADNLYLLGNGQINKIANAISGNNLSRQAWSQEGNSPASDAVLMAIDGKIYVLDGSGVLETYFKGKKTGTVNTKITADSSNQLLTSGESPNLFLINKKLGRIYVINKETGELVKTLKVGNSQPIISAGINESDAIFIITSDNKVWKIQ